MSFYLPLYHYGFLYNLGSPATQINNVKKVILILSNHIWDYYKCRGYYFSSKIVSCGQVFESVQAVPMSCSSTARIMVNHLQPTSKHHVLMEAPCHLQIVKRTLLYCIECILMDMQWMSWMCIGWYPVVADRYNNLSATTGYHPMHIHDICISSLCIIYCTFAYYCVCVYICVHNVECVHTVYNVYW